MQFRLVYEGRLPANGRPGHKQAIRRALHPQLRELWTHPPLDSYAEQWLLDEPDPNDLSVVTRVGDFRFATLVCEPLKLFVELDIVLLRPTTPGALIRQGGDIDNQLKTLFDALRMPHNVGELPHNDHPADDEDPFHCLLDDDERIVRVGVEVDRYLAAPDSSSVRVEMFVRTRPARVTYGNLPLT